MSDFELPNSTASRGAKHGPARSPKPQAPPTVKASTLMNESGDSENTGDLESKVVEPEYSKEELLRIFDEIIFSGEYSESFLIRGRLPVTFKTRTAEEVNAIQKAIDSAGLNLISSVEMMKSILNLQYSLASYDGKDLSGMKPDERHKVIERLPGPVVGILIDMMSKFDRKIALACKEGEENF